MAYVITQPCCNDATCLEVCPVDCIRPTPADPGFATAEMLHIDPGTCIDCGACAEECPVDAIFAADELPEEHARYASVNADWFDRHPLESSWDALEPGGRVTLPPDTTPLRVAIVGSGPAACYAAADLIGRAGAAVEVEMFDRLPTPWGLIRAGVAPDHPGTKAITDVFRATTSNPAFAFRLNVEIGADLSHDDLMAHHHAVIYAVGAAGDRRLGVPGEDFAGCHGATEFVAWYNGHPDRADARFDLSGERVVIVGNGNVALDVARILVSDPDELAATDIADHALEALRASNIREVVLLGRRGPAEAAYTSPELIALGRLPGVDVVVDALAFDEHARGAAGDDASDAATALKTAVAAEYAERPPTPGNRRIVLRYMVSPVVMLGEGRVEGVRIVHNALVDEDGVRRAEPTDRYESIETSLVLRAIGYRGTAVPGLPFDEDRGVIPNAGGRVADPRTGAPLPGVYAAGWIKRGPSGVIGTNKRCAQETVAHLLDDAVAGRLVAPTGNRDTLTALLRARSPEVVDGEGWRAIDAAERDRGRTQGRPRTKFTDIESMLAAASPGNLEVP
ncbi:FAD-dependent oxidoreductase [Rhodococcus olei]|uniref:ferredoxin--NADP(+) reductase n=1 Tax=Rhodococcus olei TaxID=2161675 RepID=A0ABP8PHF6_9NOCA